MSKLSKPQSETASTPVSACYVDNKTGSHVICLRQVEGMTGAVISVLRANLGADNLYYYPGFGKIFVSGVRYYAYTPDRFQLVVELSFRGIELEDWMLDDLTVLEKLSTGGHEALAELRHDHRLAESA